MDIPHTVFDYEPIDYSTEDFRLLKLLGSRDGEIECQLYHAKFDSQPYEALSYSWGVLELVEPIQVNGSTLRVTDNLYAALRHLRLPDRDRVLWIDAICINQGDENERSHQVQRMKHIYQNAERVIVWLGKATVEVEMLFHRLRHFEEQDAALDSHDKAPEDPRLLTGLQTLLRRSWFERVWILQEIANARSAVVCAGKESISASVFARAPGYLGLELDSHIRSVLDLMSHPSTDDMPWNRGQNLCTLLLKFQGCKASDERDKVYALLGMLLTDQMSRSLLPDYKLRLTDVVQTTIHYMLEENHLAIDTVLDFLTSFSSLTAVCIGPHSAQLFPNTNAQQDSEDAKLRALVNKVPFMFLLETTSTPDHFEGQTLFSQATQLSASQTSLTTENLDTVKTFTWGRYNSNVKILLVQDVTRLIVSADLLNCRSIVEVLVTHGTALGARPGFLNETILRAASRDRSELIQFLIQKGADVNAHASNHEYARFQSPDDGNVVQVASTFGCKRAVEVLIKAGADVNGKLPAEGRSALAAAAGGGYEEIVKILIEAGADINGKEGQYETPLSSAASQGREKAVEALIQAGAIAKAGERNIAKALRSAASQRNPKIVELLVSAGVDVNAREDSFPTALQTAAQRGHFQTTKILVEAGADLNALDDDGFTPLHWASYIGHKRLAEILLDAGADVNTFAGSSRNALEVALSHGHAHIAQMLLDHGADVYPPGGGVCCYELREAIVRNPEKVREMVMAFDGQKRTIDLDGDDA